MILSSTLEAIHNSEIGQYLQTKALSPDLQFYEHPTLMVKYLVGEID